MKHLIKKTNTAWIAFLILISFITCWYFLIKNYDYEYRFTSKAASGTIYQKIIDWTTGQGTLLDSVIITNKVPFKSIEQTIWKENESFILNWEIKKNTDSLSNVVIGVNALHGSIPERFKILIGKNRIKTSTISTFKTFKQYLDNFLINTRINPEIVYEEIAEVWCAYLPLEGKIQTKALKMIASNSLITEFITANSLKVMGNPYVEIKEWDLKEQYIKYNFCFPVDSLKELPQHELIKFKKSKSQKAIKLVYFGNYRTSERGWYKLYEYAQINNIPVTLKPKEVFYSNPITSGNELTWKAEIFLPLEN